MRSHRPLSTWYEEVVATAFFPWYIFLRFVNFNISELSSLLSILWFIVTFRYTIATIQYWIFFFILLLFRVVTMKKHSFVFSLQRVKHALHYLHLPDRMIFSSYLFIRVERSKNCVFSFRNFNCTSLLIVFNEMRVSAFRFSNIYPSYLDFQSFPPPFLSHVTNHCV